MSGDTVVGVYLERNGGAIMCADAIDENNRRQITPTHFEEVAWDPDDIESAREGVEALARRAIEIPGRNSIAVASYGPFLSVRRVADDKKYRSEEFGKIHPETAHLPLRGLDLRTIFPRHVTIHTDAEACAIGEAMIRGLEDHETLAYLLVTEGIGLGVVQGQRPLRSALHSEMGMLHVRYHDKDPLTPLMGNLYAMSLSEMAANEAMRTRLRQTESGKAWDIRAYYLSQACLACAVILAPHKIVVSLDLESNENDFISSKLVDKHFRKFLKERYVNDQPVFDFDELDGPDYIDNPRSIPQINEKPSFRVTGSLGMCYAAATAPRRAIS